MNTKTILIACLIITLSSCGSGGIVSSQHNEISVTSNPSGASVYVMGDLQGVTPVSINLTRLYPATYSKEFSHLYGYIVLKKDGCKNKTVKVTHDITSSGLKENLTCKLADKAVTKELVENGNRVVDKPVKLRLKELQTLKEEGMVNDDEYRKIRQRILESI